MPNIKSAKKRMRQAVKKTAANDKHRHNMEGVFKKAKKSTKKTDKAKFVSEAYSIIDKAAKNKVITKKTAARRKSRINQLVSTN